jgi:hypothetical protein
LNKKEKKNTMVRAFAWKIVKNKKKKKIKNNKERILWIIMDYNG